MKKFWKKNKRAVISSGIAIVVGLKIGSKYHESIQKGFDDVNSAGKTVGTTIKGGATQTFNYVKGLFSNKPR